MQFKNMILISQTCSRFLGSTVSSPTTYSLYLKFLWDFQRPKLETKYNSQVPIWNYSQYGQHIMDKLVKIGISGAGNWAWGISVDVGDSKKHLPIYTNQKSNTATPVQCRPLKVFPTYTFHPPIYTLLWTPNPHTALLLHVNSCAPPRVQCYIVLETVYSGLSIRVHTVIKSAWCPIYFVQETLG